MMAHHFFHVQMAKWLSECEEVMPELKGLWGYTDNEEVLKQSIENLEAEHKRRIDKIKRESAATSSSSMTCLW